MREVQVPKEDFMVGLDYMHKGATLSSCKCDTC
jgi:hypothetical protein